MDTDPALDLHPPRYAVESDSEDEYDQNVHRPPRKAESHNIELSVDSAMPSGSKLLVLCGHAGDEWTRGIKLGEQVGRLLYEDLEVGLLYSLGHECLALRVTHILPAASSYQAATVILSKCGDS